MYVRGYVYTGSTNKQLLLEFWRQVKAQNQQEMLKYDVENFLKIYFCGQCLYFSFQHTNKAY
jgi:hypothetical protein